MTLKNAVISGPFHPSTSGIDDSAKLAARRNAVSNANPGSRWRPPFNGRAPFSLDEVLADTRPHDAGETQRQMSPEVNERAQATLERLRRCGVSTRVCL